MSIIDDIFTAKNARPIWRKLNDSIVPIVSKEQIKAISEKIDHLRSSIKKNDYIPSIGHGYLGYAKESGCTRFVPILTAEDMTVYYLLVLSLQDHLIEDLPGVYGAYRSIPSKAKKQKNVEKDDQIIDPYFQDTFSKKAWFKDWAQFTDLLRETCADKTVGNYVLTSDIANFYDTIDVSRLINRVRSVVSGNEELISLLGYFLNFWDRRIKGYTPSSKGIPQEIISDASRIVSNFYLGLFDKEFIEYTKSQEVLYIRWADDIVLFGKSKIHLERVMHHASRLLLNHGLNLNASKTKHYSRRQFADYRALSLLNTVKKKDFVAFERELRRFDNRYKSDGGRIDTVVKASLNLLSAEPKARTHFAMSYLEDRLKEYKHLSSLNENQILKKHLLFDNISVNMKRGVDTVLRYPYAAPRVTYISFLAKHHQRLIKEGVALKMIKGLVEKIDNLSPESEITKQICAPAARSVM